MTTAIDPEDCTPAFRLKDAAFKTAFLFFTAAMPYILITDGDGCGDTPMDVRFFSITGILAPLLAIGWSLIDKQRYPYSRLKYFFQLVLRYFVAYKLMEFGAAKVLDVQFFPNLTSLDTPIADMHPSSLLWSFFGRSFHYELFIGYGQILAVLLLLFRRTSTLGAILLTIIMCNVVFVNFAYDVCVKFFSSTFLAMTLYLLADDAPRLINILLVNRPAEKRVYPVLVSGGKARKALFVACILAGLFSALYPFYYMYTGKIKYGIGVRTDLYGAWAVDSLHHSVDSVNQRMNADSTGWRKVLFDEGKQAASKSWRKRIERFSYDVNSAARTVRMKGEAPDSLLVINAGYRLKNDTLYLSGTYGTDSLYMRLHLLRKYFIRDEDKARTYSQN